MSNVIQQALQSIRKKAGEILGSEYINNLSNWSNPTVRKEFNQEVIQPKIQKYQEQVAYNKQNLPSPFFNNTGNNPVQWLGKVVQDTKKRGVIEGLQDLTNPIIQNPKIYPYAEPIISNTRMYVSKIPNTKTSTQVMRKLLGLPLTINKY